MCCNSSDRSPAEGGGGGGGRGSRGMCRRRAPAACAAQQVQQASKQPAEQPAGARTPACSNRAQCRHSHPASCISLRQASRTASISCGVACCFTRLLQARAGPQGGESVGMADQLEAGLLGRPSVGLHAKGAHIRGRAALAGPHPTPPHPTPEHVELLSALAVQRKGQAGGGHRLHPRAQQHPVAQDLVGHLSAGWQRGRAGRGAGDGRWRCGMPG